ncbi:MAG: hypothetical protein FWF92_11310 [Oscillospiraceae bacterium]|nr:hypothetical protein [Oscillospiraceae bacterium]
MYMRNNSYNKYSKYNIDDFPPNYSGQYTKESIYNNNYNIDQTGDIEKNSNNFIHDSQNLHNQYKRDGRTDEQREQREHKIRETEESTDIKEPRESREKRSGSLFSGLFGGNKNKDGDGKKRGLFSGFFNRGDNKDGGIFSHIEIEDLILLAVIFFLLKDGFEDDLILILAIILFAA